MAGLDLARFRPPSPATFGFSGVGRVPAPPTEGRHLGIREARRLARCSVIALLECQAALGEGDLWVYADELDVESAAVFADEVGRIISRIERTVS